MIRTRFSFRFRPSAISNACAQSGAPGGRNSKRQVAAMRLVAMIILAVAVCIAWKTHWFHAEPDVSGYPEIRLAFTTCKFERIAHSRGSTTKQIVFLAENVRYVMEEGVWGRHFTGPRLATAFSGG